LLCSPKTETLVSGPVHLTGPFFPVMCVQDWII